MTPEPALRLRADTRLRTDLAAWAQYCLPPPQAPAAHHLALIERLAEVRAGRIDRLMVLMPPGAAKSTYAALSITSGYSTANAMRWAARVISAVELQ